MGAVGRGELRRCAAGLRNLEQATKFANPKHDPPVSRPGATLQRAWSVTEVGQSTMLEIERPQLAARGKGDGLIIRRPKRVDGDIGPRKEVGICGVQRPNPYTDM